MNINQTQWKRLMVLLRKRNQKIKRKDEKKKMLNKTCTTFIQVENGS